MKNIILALCSLFLLSISLNAQGFCAFTKHQKKIEAKNPKFRAERERIEQEVREELRATNTIGFKDGDYSGKIYEIPVVVHVIENRTGNGNTGKDDGTLLTDNEIKQWIESANAMFASTYVSQYFPEDNSFFPVGKGANKGAVIPFKLVLAKRSPNCKATSGIIRYDASAMKRGAGDLYATAGLSNNGSAGANEDAMLELAPHWPENTYYNIYLVTGFDANFSEGGIMGFASYCTLPNAQYHAVMKVGTLTATDDSTLAHEFGHALGLMHTFEGADAEGQNCPNAVNDEVDDTEISKSLLSVYPTPKNSDINPCTGVNYQGVQYNVMNYTASVKKFTVGQRERALKMFLKAKPLLAKSVGAQELGTLITVRGASCNVTAVEDVNSMDNVGAINIKFGMIQNESMGYVASEANGKPYIDYTAQSCYNKSILTEIPLMSATKMVLESGSAINQTVRVWIDYNDNGVFESAERIVDIPEMKSVYLDANVKPYTFDITPPASAVTDKFLRMRVAGDVNSNLKPCGIYKSGQAQDYLVKIKKATATPIHSLTPAEAVVIYERRTKTLRLAQGVDGFGKYKIYDVNGFVVKEGNTHARSISLGGLVSQSVYILEFEVRGKRLTYKF